MRDFTLRDASCINEEIPKQFNTEEKMDDEQYASIVDYLDKQVYPPAFIL